MVDEVAKTSLVFDASGATAGAAQFEAAVNKIVGSANQTQNALAKTNEILGRTADTLRRVDSEAGAAQFLTRFARSFDPLSGAIQKAQADLDRLNGIILKGGENGARAANLIDGATKKLQALQFAAGQDKQLDAIWSSFSNRIIALTEAFDPATTSARQMTAQLSELNAAQRLGINIAGGYEAAFNRIVASYDQGAIAARKLAEQNAALVAQGRAESLQQVAADNQSAFNKVLGVGGTGKSAQESAAVFMAEQAAIEKENAALVAQSAAFGGVSAEVARLERMSEQLVLAQSALARQMQAGTISTSAANKELRVFSETEFNVAKATQLLQSGQMNVAQVAQAFPSLFARGSAVMQDLTRNTNAATHAFGLNRIGFLQLQASGVNAFQALASGMSVWRVAQTEGAQVLGAFIQGVEGVGSALLRWAPIAGIIAAVTASLAILISRASQAASDLRSFNLEIMTFGGGATNVTAQGLRDIVTRLRDLGESAADAKTAVSLLFAAPAINRSYIESIATLAHDVAALPGRGTFIEETKKLSEALNGNVEEIIKYGAALNAFDANEIQAIRAMAERGQVIEANTRAFDDIRAAVQSADLGMSPLALKFRDLGVAWNQLIDSLSQSSFIQGLSVSFNFLIDKITELVQGLNDGSSAINVISNAAVNAAGSLFPLIGVFQAIGAAYTYFDVVKEAVLGLASAISDELLKAWDSVTAKWEKIQDFLKPIVATFNEFTAAVLALVTAFDKDLTESWKSIQSTLSQYTWVQTVIDGFQSISQAVKDALASVKEFVSYLQNSMIGGALSSLLNIPTNLIKGGAQAIASATGTSLTRSIAGEGSGPSAIEQTTPTLLQGGVANFTVGSLAIDTQDLQRLRTVLSFGASALPTGYSVMATSTERPGALVAGGGGTSYHATGQAIDVRIVGPNGQAISGTGLDITGLYGQLAVAAYRANQQLYPGTNLAWGGNFASMRGGVNADLMHFDTGPQRGNLGTPLPALASGVIDPTRMQLLDANVQQYVKTTRELTDAERLLGLQEVQRKAEIQAIQEAYKAGENDEQSAIRIKAAVAAATDRYLIGLQKEADAADRATQGNLKTAEAYKQNAVAGLQAAAMEQAKELAITRSVDKQQEYQRILNASAAGALLIAQQQKVATDVQINAYGLLAVAAESGAAAEHKQQIENTATAATQDVLNKAMAAYGAAVQSNNPAQIASTKIMLDAAKAAQAEAIGQAQVIDKLKQRVEIAHQIRTDQNAIEVARLELSLVGQTADEIAKQVDLLRTKQQLEEMGLTAADELYQARLREREALDDTLQRLKQAQELQSRWGDAIRNVGDSLASGIGQAITDMLNGKKITDWANTFKNALQQIGQQLLEIAFIKPAIGSIMSLLGVAPSVVSSFGTLGSLFSSGAIGSSGQQISGTTSGGQTFTGTLSNAGSAISAGNSISQLGDGGGLFSSNGLFGGLNLGGALGFATPLSTTGSTAAALAGLEGGGAATSALAEGSLFGTTTLGSVASFLGPIAAVGGILASFLPSIIGKGSQNNSSSSSLIGGQIGLYGPNQANSRTSSQLLTQLQGMSAALANAGLVVPTVNATYGSKTGIQSRVEGQPETHYGSLSAANVGTWAQMQAALQQLNPGFQTFADVLMNVDKQAKAVISDTSSSFDDLSAAFNNTQQTFKSFYDVASSVSQPVDELEQRFAAIGRLITNAQLDKLADGIKAIGDSSTATFADAVSAFGNLQQQYKVLLQEASASYNSWGLITNRFQELAKALISVELDKLTQSIYALANAAHTVPAEIANFVSALNDLQKTWAELLTQASAAGQTWDSVTTQIRNLATFLLNSAVNQVTPGLTKEFSSVPMGQFADELSKVANIFNTLTDEANAFGVSTSYIANVLIQERRNLTAAANATYRNAILQITDPKAYAIQQEQLAASQRIADALAYNAATPHTKIDVDLIKQFNELNMTKVVAQFDAAGNAATDLASALKSVADALAQLKSGTLSGMTLAQQAAAAYDDFQKTYAAAKKGDVTAIAAIGEKGTTTVNLYQQAYGNAPITTGQRDTIVSELEKVLAAGGKAFAGGTENTPRGLILVGERGPEIIHQRGGLAVTPFDRVAPSIKEAIKGNPAVAANTNTVAKTTIAKTMIDRTNQKTMLILSSLLERVSHHTGLSMPLLNQLFQITKERRIEALRSFETFQSTFQAARRGDPLSIAALPEKAIAAKHAYMEIYGNSASTSQINNIITKELSQTLAAGGRAFASGTAHTPSGLILVGERGPEIVTRSGSLAMPPSFDRLPQPSNLNNPLLPRPGRTAPPMGNVLDFSTLQARLTDIKTAVVSVKGAVDQTRNQMRGGQSVAHDDAQTSHKHLSEMARQSIIPRRKV